MLVSINLDQEIRAILHRNEFEVCESRLTNCLAPPGWVDLRASRLYDAATYLKEQLICR
jgi:hypothetical protein